MEKRGRNDPCICKSGKKYKKCCLPFMQESKYNTGQSDCSDLLLPILIQLKEELTQHVVINVTDDLTVDTYREYQIRNMRGNVVMLAEKTEKNQEVFRTRILHSDSNIMMMYHGAYRTFSADTFEQVLQSLRSFVGMGVGTRVGGEVDTHV